MLASNRGLKPTTITRCDKQMTLKNKPHRFRFEANVKRAEMTETHRSERHTHTQTDNANTLYHFGFFKDDKNV